MRWESIKSATDQKEFILWHNNKKAISLVFHLATNSARIETAGEKRVFQVRREGFRRNRTAMRNEYGVLIGLIRYENKEPLIELNNERFSYHFRNNPLPELVVSKEATEKPFAVCTMNILSESLSTSKPVSSNLESCLLLSLCWYLVSKDVKGKQVKLAV